MLPKPASGFEWAERGGRPALVCHHLAAFVPHFFTTRSWALGAAAADDGAWAEVADAAGVRLRNLRRLKQVHGADVVVVRAGDAPFDTPPAADILASDARGFAVAVQAADCVPLLIGDRHTGVVAAAHAGWRGLAAGVPRAAVDALRADFGSIPGDLVVAVGPSIGGCCYEVGDEVRARFAEAFDRAADAWFTSAPLVVPGNAPFRAMGAAPGKWFFNGWQAAHDQLAAAGVPPAHIHLATLCTASHPVTFCSYRRDGAKAGRIAGVIAPDARVGREPNRTDATHKKTERCGAALNRVEPDCGAREP